MSLRQLLKHLRAQDGLTLVMAIGILGVLTLSGTTLVYYSSTNARSAVYSDDNSSAYDLAEAGINEMMAILAKPDNNALNKYLLGLQEDGSVTHTVHEYDDGTVEWWGTLDEATATWSLTSIGQIANKSGSAPIKRTLKAQVPVTPTVTQPLNNPSWNYVMSTQVTGGECDMTISNNVEVRSNLYVFGNLCLQNQAKILKGLTYPTLAVIKGKVTQFTQHNTIGTSTEKMAEVHVGTGCKWFTNAFYNPCVTGSQTSIYADVFGTSPITLVAPVADFASWYLNASPGPYYPCYTQSGTPPVFDSPVAGQSASNEEKLTYKNNNQSTAFNLTPSSSYSCTTAGGELSYNASTKKLTVSGTIYIDGDAKVEHSSQTTVEYVGQGSIYLSGSLKIKNTKLCGGLSSGNCDFANWDPNTRMLAFVVDGQNRQSEVASGTGVRLLNSHLQGAIYATYKIDIDTSSKVDGPLVGSEVVFGQSTSTNDFPTITTVPAGMPGNPSVYAQPNAPQLYSG
jgi:hypothetical protein